MRFYVPTAVRMSLRGTCISTLYSQLDRWVLTASQGRIGAHLSMPSGQPQPPVLVLETRGRRSGKLRGTPLIYLEQPDGYLVVASNAGHPNHPAWLLNLRADPHAHVRIGPERLAVTASELNESDRATAWPELLAIYPPYADYQRSTQRILPVVHLRRSGEGD